VSLTGAIGLPLACASRTEITDGYSPRQIAHIVKLVKRWGAGGRGLGRLACLEPILQRLI